MTIFISSITEEFPLAFGFRISSFGLVEVVGLLRLSMHGFVFILGAFVELLGH